MFKSATSNASALVAIYARVSSDEQVASETIQVQLDFLRGYCGLHGVSVAGEYLDDGVTGTAPLPQRPAGARLLADARAGRFGTVIFYRISRLGRRLAIVLDAYEELDRAGVVVRSATEPIDTANPVGRFVFQLLAAFAELDRETLLDNTSRGRARGARHGRWYGVVPTGYSVRDGVLVPNESEIVQGLTEADLVRDIYRRIAEGSSSIKVAAYVSSLGIGRFKRYAKHDGREVVLPGRAGWSPKRVSELIRNPTYRGTHIYKGKHGDIERQVPALVTEDLWQKANDQLTRNRTFARRSAKRTYMLRMLVRCQRCGVAYKGEEKKGYRFYRCAYTRPIRDADPTMRCRSRSVGADALEEVVWRDLETFLRDPGTSLDQARHRMLERHQGAGNFEETRQDLSVRLGAKQHERAQILELLRRGALTLEEAERELFDIGLQQAALQEELKLLEGTEALYDGDEAHLRSAERLLEDLRGRLNEGLDDATRQAVVRALVRKVEVEPRDGTRGPASVTIEYAFSAQSGLVSGSC